MLPETSCYGDFKDHQFHYLCTIITALDYLCHVLSRAKVKSEGNMFHKAEAT